MTYITMKRLEYRKLQALTGEAQNPVLEEDRTSGGATLCENISTSYVQFF